MAGNTNNPEAFSLPQQPPLPVRPEASPATPVEYATTEIGGIAVSYVRDPARASATTSSVPARGADIISILGGLEDRGWQARANCRGVDPDLFFPEQFGGSTKEAKEVCRACVVQSECLEFALANSEKFGVWGGMSERERRRLRRARALERRAASAS